MPDMPTAHLVAVSDIHLTATTPVSRAEKDWPGTILLALAQAIAQANALGVPLVIAGDVFDRWFTPNEVVNRTIAILAQTKHGVYGVPGQHDLPGHNYSEIERTAYWTLCAAGVLTNLEPEAPKTLPTGRTRLWGVPWNHSIPAIPLSKTMLDVAVVHAYIHTRETGYVGASEAKLVAGYSEDLKGFGAAVFGDNHKGFISSTSWGCAVLNSGVLVRRASDERDKLPGYGVLYSTPEGVAYWERVHTDREADWHPQEHTVALPQLSGQAVQAVLASMRSGDTALDFEMGLRAAMETQGTRPEVRQCVALALEQAVQRG
jgi:hypothetical protein